MKRFISIFLIIVMAFTCLAGCTETHVVTPIEAAMAIEPTGFVPSPEGQIPDFLYNYGTKDFTFTLKDYRYNEETKMSEVVIYIKNSADRDLWVDLTNVSFNAGLPINWGVKIAAMTERDITLQLNNKFEKIVSITADFEVSYKENDTLINIIDEYIDINFA